LASSLKWRKRRFGPSPAKVRPSALSFKFKPLWLPVPLSGICLCVSRADYSLGAQFLVILHCQECLPLRDCFLLVASDKRSALLGSFVFSVQQKLSFGLFLVFFGCFNISGVVCSALVLCSLRECVLFVVSFFVPVLIALRV
jgi:hypothetical protein